MKHIVLLLCFCLSTFATTKSELEQLKPLKYLPEVYDEGFKPTYQGDPKGFYPIGLAGDSTFYYIELVSGQCCSEADQGWITLYCQNLITDSTTVVDSFSVRYSYAKTGKNIPYWTKKSEQWKSCHDIYKDLITQAPDRFLKTVTTLPVMNRSYQFTSKAVNGVSFSIMTAEMQKAPELKDMSRKRYELKDKVIVAQSAAGTKKIFTVNDNSYVQAGYGDIAGAIHFKKSKRAIVVIAFRVGWFDPFHTIGCHLTSGFKK